MFFWEPGCACQFLKDSYEGSWERENNKRWGFFFVCLFFKFNAVWVWGILSGFFVILFFKGSLSYRTGNLQDWNMEVQAQRQMDILEKEVKFVWKPEAVITIYFFWCYRQEVSCNSAFWVPKSSQKDNKQSRRGKLNTLQSCSRNQPCGKVKTSPLLPQTWGAYCMHT